jgi:hypothetical protein
MLPGARAGCEVSGSCLANDLENGPKSDFVSNTMIAVLVSWHINIRKTFNLGPAESTTGCMVRVQATRPTVNSAYPA